MKSVLLAILIVAISIQKHRQRRAISRYGIVRGNNQIDDPELRVKEYAERKVGLFARINVDPNMKGIMNIDGLTSNYSQMLMNPNSYVVLRKNPAQQLDINKKIVIGLKPTQRNLGYSYGEVDQEHTYDKDEYEYTNNYKEMLANPQKKMLLLGLHPQLNSINTRAITPQMEDPIIQISKEEKDEQQKSYEERLQQKQREIQEYLDTIHQQLKTNVQQVSTNQIKIVKNIRDYLKEVGDAAPMKKFQDLIDQILNTFSKNHGQSKKDESSRQQKGKKESQNDEDQEHEKQSDKDKLQQQEMQDQVQQIQQANDGLVNRFAKNIEQQNQQKQQKEGDSPDNKSDGMKQIESFMRKNGIKILDNMQDAPFRFNKQPKKNIKQLLEDQLKLQEQMKENEKEISQVLTEQKQKKSSKMQKKYMRRR